MILVIRMFAFVTLVVSPEVLDRAIVPVVPHGTVTMVNALIEPTRREQQWLLTRNLGMTEPPESSPRERVRRCCRCPVQRWHYTELSKHQDRLK